MDLPDLFAAPGSSDAPLPPLAVRMRPRSLEEVRGQSAALRPGSPLRRLIEGHSGAVGPLSAILWGPPGTGKTTLAHLVATAAGRRFVQLSAITAGVKDVRRVIANGVEWAKTLRPERTDPVLLRYETEDFYSGHGYQGAMSN